MDGHALPGGDRGSPEALRSVSGEIEPMEAALHTASAQTLKLLISDPL